MWLNRRQFGKLATASVTGGALGLLDGPASAEGAVQRVTHAMSAGDIASLDPTLAWSSAESPVITVIMEGLVSYPPGTVSTDFIPALAERWTISPDGRLYEFSLRKGVQWHENVGEFTAEDVKFTLDRYRDPKISPWSPSYNNVTGVEAVDKYTVRITLNSPDPFFLALLATDTESVGPMVSKKAFETRGADNMRLHPVGTGPFRFKEYVPKDRLVMVRHDDYWAGRPHLDEVVIRFMPSSASRELALRTGEIDTMRAAIDGQLLDRITKQGFLLDNKGPEILWWLHINTKVQPLDDIRVRQAIAHAINPADMKLMLGPVATISTPLIPPSYFGAASPDEIPVASRWGYDPDKAKRLLAEAGHAKDIKLDMIISERDDYSQMMVLMQEELQQVGINLALTKVDHSFYHSQIVRYVNPLVLYGDISYPNSEILLNRAFRSTAIRNFSGWKSAEFDALMQQVASTPDLEQRRKLLVSAQQQAAKQFLVVPTTYTGQPLVRSKRVDLGYQLKSSLALEYRFGWQTRVAG